VLEQRTYDYAGVHMRSVKTLFVSLAVFIGVIAAAGGAHAEEPAAISGQPGTMRVQPMSDDRFWALIGSTAAFESDPKRQLAALHAALQKLPIGDIEAYEAAFDEHMRRSYSWDLWGAAYVVHGGASDDGFEYFRCWLMSKGRGVFDKVTADPDSLADLLVGDVEGVLEFEDFAYVARQVWSEKTGLPSNQMPEAANMSYPGLEPSGTKFEEDAAYLSRRYPKLWRRFGSHPLE
jgi:hypothetical protein